MSMNEEKLSEYAPELYEALKNLLDEIPVIARDSKFAQRVYEAVNLKGNIDYALQEGELKACPFCGYKVQLHDEEDERLSALGCEQGNWGYNRFVISCPMCGAYSGSALSAQEAIAAWNRRAG